MTPPRFSAEFLRTVDACFAEIRRGPKSFPQILEERTTYGQKYAIRATPVGPSGSAAGVTSIWIVRTGEDFPRFVTASRRI